MQVEYLSWLLIKDVPKAMTCRPLCAFTQWLLEPPLSLIAATLRALIFSLLPLCCTPRPPKFKRLSLGNRFILKTTLELL